MVFACQIVIETYYYMDSLYKAAKIFNKIAQEMQTVPTAANPPAQTVSTTSTKSTDVSKPVKAPKYTSEMKDNVEYRDRFHGAQGEERQKLIEEEAKKKGFTLVPDKITPMNEAEVINIVRSIIDRDFPNLDDDTKQEFTFTIVPQIRLETGYKSHQWNCGNLHAYPGGQNQYWTGEVSAWNDPQNSSSGKYIQKDWFWRAYKSLDAGINDWFNLLKKRFPEAINAAKNGDVEGFVKIIKAKGYFTADVNTYTKGIKNIKEKMKNKYYRDAHV